MAGAQDAADLAIETGKRPNDRVDEEEPPSKRPCVDDAETPNDVKESDAATPAVEAEEDGIDAETNIPRDPVKIGYKTFDTGKKCYEYFHHIMKNYRKKQNLNDYEFHNVMELIRTGHPEADRKLAIKVNAIQIRDMFLKGRSSCCFHLLRVDGTTDDVSYRKCISKLFPEMVNLLATKPNNNNNSNVKQGNKKVDGKKRGHGNKN